MDRPNVYVTRKVAQQALDKIASVANVKVWGQELPPPTDTLLAEVAQIDGLFCLLTDKVDRPVMEAAPRLKVISNMAVGYDNVDVAEATRRGIRVGYTPGLLTQTTADFAFALLLAAARRVVEADRYTRAGRWKTWAPTVLLGQDVYGATLGIVGLGRIGQEVAKRAKSFSMKVMYFGPRRHAELERDLDVEYTPDLLTLMSKSDFVSIHAPLNAQTRRLIGARELGAMKPTAVLVNTARGPIVDQRALWEALRDRRIFAAATDVTDVEPIPLDDPLLGLDNVIVTPHIASASEATRTRMAVLAAVNLIAGLQGRPMPHCVNL